jgi:hypothetical protein
MAFVAGRENRKIDWIDRRSAYLHSNATDPQVVDTMLILSKKIQSGVGNTSTALY